MYLYIVIYMLYIYTYIVSDRMVELFDLSSLQKKNTTGVLQVVKKVEQGKANWQERDLE